VSGPYSFDGVYACGPNSTNGPTPFDNAGPNGTQSFQCTELSERFLWAIYELPPLTVSGVDGADLVSDYHAANPSIPAVAPGPTNLPQPGDVMSFGQGGPISGSEGHTAVVVSTPDASGTFTIMSQNWTGNAGEESVQIDMSGAHNGEVTFPGSNFWNGATFLAVANQSPGGPVISSSPGTMDLFYVDSGNALRTMWNQGSGWGGPGLLANSVQGTPVGVSPEPGQKDLFYVTSANVLQTKWYQGTWQGPGNLAYNVTGRPAVASPGNGQMDVVYKGANGGLFSKFWNGSTWSGPTTLTTAAVSDPVIISPSPGALDVFFRSGAGTLYTMWSNGNNVWSGTGILAGSVADTPAVVSPSPGTMDLFYVGTDGSIHTLWYDGVWHGGRLAGPNSAFGDPAVVSPLPGAMEVFYRGTDGAMHALWYNGIWSGGTLIGSVHGVSVDGNPVAVSPGAGTMDMFFQGSDSAIHTMWWSQSSGWDNQGAPAVAGNAQSFGSD
jgi:hypothetical protein